MKQLIVFGPGCAKCKILAEHAEKAAKELGIEYNITKIEDINQILSFGIMMTPALMIDGELKASGRILSSDEIKLLLQKA